MLLNSLYKYQVLEKKEESLLATITLNKDHEIYKGHFPGNPVTPGACQVQIIKEVLSDILKKEISLNKAKEIKFINPLLPVENNTSTLTINYQPDDNLTLNVQAKISDEEKVFLKLKGTYNG